MRACLRLSFEICFTARLIESRNRLLDRRMRVEWVGSASRQLCSRHGMHIPSIDLYPGEQNSMQLSSSGNNTESWHTKHAVFLEFCAKGTAQTDSAGLCFNSGGMKLGDCKNTRRDIMRMASFGFSIGSLAGLTVALPAVELPKVLLRLVNTKGR